MSANVDCRVAELEALAEEENITLPYPASYISFLEAHGRYVDLCTGEVIYAQMVAAPTASGRAVAHLLSDAVGAVAL